METINNYAHDYRGMAMSEEELKNMLIEVRKEILVEVKGVIADVVGNQLIATEDEGRMVTHGVDKLLDKTNV